MESASLMTMIGSTGSGKSQLILSYLDYLTEKSEIHELGIRAFDVTRVEYYYKDPIYLWVEEHRRFGEQQATGLDEDLATVNKRISTNSRSNRKIFIHITECDIMASDDQGKMLELCDLVAKHGQNINVQLLYETSRPSINVMPAELSKKSDLRIMAHTPVTQDISHFISEFDSVIDLVHEGRKYITCDKNGTLFAYQLILDRIDGDAKTTTCTHCGGADVCE